MSRILLFLAAILVPWKIDLYFNWDKGENRTMSVVADINYLCPPPFCSNQSIQYVASNSMAVLTLPSHMEIVDWSLPAEVSLGSIIPGSTTSVTWKVSVNDTYGKSGKEEFLQVKAYGLISGAVPYTYWGGYDGYQYIPGYSYQDVIGGTAKVMY